MRVLAGVGAAVVAGEVTVDDFRVQGLSPTLIRVEPRGPLGYENRTTFAVVNRSWGDLELAVVNRSEEGAWISGEHYEVFVGSQLAPVVPSPTCASPAALDAEGNNRVAAFPGGINATGMQQCCDACEADASCVGWVFGAQEKTKFSDVPGANCWPLARFSALSPSTTRKFACSSRGCQVARLPTVKVVVDGAVVYDSTADKRRSPNLLHWPSPTTQPAYALTDFPRFHVPEWATAPAPGTVDPHLAKTNGYDFSNNVNGDTYIFLLGSTTGQWRSSREEFLHLCGQVPLLPDYAYGTWFTWWHPYTQDDAEAEVKRWTSDGLPLDIWGLDMNWRNTTDHEDWFYNYPASQLFPNYTNWFSFLKSQGLRTYFNDHPYPVAGRGAGGLQTSPEEIKFRWEGLTQWMDEGLTFWWFDHNWGFSIPAPMENSTAPEVTSSYWDGLSNGAWGTHVYYSNVDQYNTQVREKKGDKFYGRTMTLTKAFLPDWVAGMEPVGMQENPAQHRYPVWWTGDRVTLEASVQTMVNAGVHDLKPFLHSDCGGDYRGPAGDYLRWAAQCVYGSILRFHGDDHRPWTYTEEVEGTIRGLLQTRYKLLPSLIAAGAKATQTGEPYVARCDLHWPEHAPASASWDQYLFLDDFLVAPIFNTTHNASSRTVWIPPGTWEDAYSGEEVVGPRTVEARQPYERIPLWHRRGGAVVSAGEALRVEDQDWSQLAVDVWVGAGQRVERAVHERGSSEKSVVQVAVDSHSTTVMLPPGRKWVLRFHLPTGVEGGNVESSGLRLPKTFVRPANAALTVPAIGVGAAPAPGSGGVVEVRVAQSAVEQKVLFSHHAVENHVV